MPARSRLTGVLVSGGLDSAALVGRLLRSGRRVQPLYVRCGLAWEAAELAWLRRFLRAIRSPRLAPLVVLELPIRSMYGRHWSLTGRRVPGSRSADAAVYLPGRNILLLTHAAVFCASRGIPTIALGLLKGNPFADASPAFLRRMAGCLSQALDRPIRVLAPIRHLTKTQVIRSAGRLPLALTFSCLVPRLPAGRQAAWRHCGRCNKCAERRKAFLAAGRADPARNENRDSSEK